MSSLGATAMQGQPLMQTNMLGPQSNGMGLTTGAPPNKPDFSTYFGKPLREVKTNPYEGYARENYALPEAYNGPNPFITRILIQLITEDDMWITRIALPFKFTEDSMEFAWNVWIFNNHGMDSVPEEGVSRLLSTQMGERRGHYTRYGLGFILEHGFMKTEKGRLCYEMNLVQIRNAILETLYYGGIEEYLMCKEYNNKWNARHGRRLEFQSIREQMQMEVDNWACIQKGDGSWDLLDSRCKRILQDAGHQPNMWILPRGMKPYIALDQSKTAYFMVGPDGRQLYNSALNGQNVNAVDIANNCQIFESKAFQMPEAAEPLDLLWRERSCGEYYLMVNHLSGRPMDRYASNWRDIVIYNEKRDQFNPVTLRTALDNCGRFESMVHGPGYLHDLEGDDDTFTYMDPMERVFKTCVFFGDMEDVNLSEETKRNVAQTVLAPILNPGCCDDFYEVWKDGMLLIRELEDSPMTPNWYTYLIAGGLVLTQDSQTGFVPLPPVTEANLFNATTKALLFVPVGFGSWPGLLALAHLSSKHMGQYHIRAVKFTNILRMLYDRMNQSLRDCIFLDEKHRSGYFIKPDGITTFFENLVSVPRPNLWFNETMGVQVDTLDITNKLELATLKQFAANEATTAYPAKDADMVGWFAENTLESTTDDKYQTFCERMRALLDGSNAWNKIEIRNVLKQIVFAFRIIKTAPQDGMKSALRFVGSLFKILDVGAISVEERAKSLVYQVAFAAKTLSAAGKATLETAIQTILSNPVKVDDDNINVTAALVAKSASDATSRKLDAWKPTQLIASKRVVQSIIDGGMTRLFPSARINGMVPPDTIGLEFVATLETGPQLDANKVFVTPAELNLLFSARDGADNQQTYNINLSTHMNTMEEETTRVGNKRRDNENTSYAFGARRRIELVEEENVSRSDYLRGYAEDHRRNVGYTGLGLYVKFSKPFQERFNKYLDESNPLNRIIIQAFLGTPITKRALVNMIENNVFFPVGFLLARPHITHLMGTAILTTSGAEVGETRVGHADFQLSDNVVQKMHYGNFTFYAKSVIYAPEKVLIVTDIIAKRYLYGDDMLFFQNDMEYKSFRQGNQEKKSILSMIVPADSYIDGYEYVNPIDLTGHYNDAMANLADASNQRPHYPSYKFYGKYFEFNNQRQVLNSSDYFNYYNNLNTIVYQGHQMNWNPGSSSHSHVVQNTGHWSYRVYEGVGAVRNGSMKLMREVNYSMYGGAGGAVPKMALGY